MKISTRRKKGKTKRLRRNEGKMRIIFMGTPDFAVPALEALIQGGHEVVAVVTQPDKPRGRGKAMQMPPVKETALKYGIPVMQPIRVREEQAVSQLRALKPDVIVVAAFGQILPRSILEIPKYGCLCIHASLLPKYRGAAPIQQAVMDGEEESGVTIMKMDEGVDTGDMLKKAAVLLDKKETGASLHDKLSALGGPLVLEVLEELEKGTAVAVPQPNEGSSYAKMLKKEMGNIDWTQSAVVIERLVRGLNSWPSAYTYFDGRTLKIWDADVEEERGEKRQPGTVAAVDKGRILVQTGDGILALKEVQLEGKKRMDAASFLRGYHVTEGMVFKRS